MFVYSDAVGAIFTVVPSVSVMFASSKLTTSEFPDLYVTVNFPVEASKVSLCSNTNFGFVVIAILSTLSFIVISKLVSNVFPSDV